jgi:5-methylcytosine-specific restriction protein A
MIEPHYKAWYKTYRWQQLRLRQLRADPLCAMCLPRCVPATICDHVEPHKGDEAKFWNGPFQSLCKQCHDSDKQRIEKGGKPRPRIGNDGWPETGGGLKSSEASRF